MLDLILLTAVRSSFKNNHFGNFAIFWLICDGFLKNQVYLYCLVKSLRLEIWFLRKKRDFSLRLVFWQDFKNSLQFFKYFLHHENVKSIFVLSTKRVDFFIILPSGVDTNLNKVLKLKYSETFLFFGLLVLIFGNIGFSFIA